MALLRDLRWALRRLARAPGFTAAALLTLALGIGAATLVYSVVDRVVLRPLPYPDAERLVAVWPQGFLTRGEFSVLDRDAETLDQVGLWIATDGFNLEAEGAAVRVSATRVTPSLLALLGLQPSAGRLFRPEDGQAGRDRVVLLDHGFWQDRFGGSEEVLGSTLQLDGESYEVVGVLPADYAFTDPDHHLLLPIPVEGEAAGPLWGFGGYRSIARLADGVSVGQADAELQRLANVARTENPVWTPPEGFRDDSRVVGLHRSLVGDVRALLLVLLGAVGILQLVVCANVANLLLTRGIARGRASAVRVALGAGRSSLVRDHLVESVVLSLGGCALGAFLAWAGLELFGSALAAELPRGSEISLDGRILGVMVALSLLTGLVAGLLPALRSASVAPAEVLRQGGARGGSSRGRRRLSRVLVTAQVSAAAILVVGAGLLGRSLGAMTQVDPGFEAEGLLTARITLAGARYADPEPRLAYLERVEERLSGLLGVQEVAVSGSLPFGTMGQGAAIRIEGVTTDPNDLPVFDHYPVDPDWLATMDIEVLDGRGIEPTDRLGTPRVALVDATAAGRFWPDESPLGKRVGWPFGADPWMTVVGVVGAVADDEVTAEPTLTLYTPFHQDPPMAASILLRRGGGSGGSAALASALRGVVTELDPAVTVSRVVDYPDLLAGSYARARLIAVLMLVFAGVTLVLGCLGVHGVAAYAVRDRTREIGIRMALGAEAGTIRTDVVRDGAILAGPGVLLGVLLAVPVVRVLDGLLFGVEPLDPVTFLGVPLVLGLAAFLAVYAPARRATRVDPARVLQSE